MVEFAVSIPDFRRTGKGRRALHQPSLRYGIEDGVKGLVPESVCATGPEPGHGRIETRTYRVYDGLDLIHDRQERSGNLTVVVFESGTLNFLK